jgi:hypothetical protein
VLLLQMKHLDMLLLPLLLPLLLQVKPAHGDWSLQQLKSLSYNWGQLEPAVDELLPHSRRCDNNRYCKSNLEAMRQPAWGQRRTTFGALQKINQASSIGDLVDLVCPGDRCVFKCAPVLLASSALCTQHHVAHGASERVAIAALM